MTWDAKRLLPAGAQRPKTVAEFFATQVTSDRGEAFSFAGREVWRPIAAQLNDVVQRGVQDVSLDVLAGAQIGKSTLMCGFAGALPAWGQNVIYFLPNDKLADRFSDTRFAPMVQRSAWMRGNRSDGSGGREVSNKNLHSVAGRWVYILGLETVTNAISIQADALIYDEVDLISGTNLEWSADRIDASKLRLQLGISVGMVQGAGIDERYQRGCQYVWCVKCPACGKDDQVLEEAFPACVECMDGLWQRVCVRCRKPYDVEACGRWVARHPNRERERHYSYRIPQLIVPAVALGGIMKKWERAKSKRSRMAKYRCSTLAMPDGGDLQPITDGVLARSRHEAYPMVLAPSVLPRYAGVDCGDSVHYACHEALPDGRMRFVYFEEMDSDSMVERIGYLDSTLGVCARVIDSKPLRTESRRLAYARPTSTWLLDFAGDGAEPEEHEDEHYGKAFLRATVGRDAALDEFTSMFVQEPPLFLLPSNDAASAPILDLVDQHLKRLTKIRTEDARGNTVEKYVTAVANHFGFAMLSSYLAEQLSGGGGITGEYVAPVRTQGGSVGVAGSQRLKARHLLEGYEAG